MNHPGPLLADYVDGTLDPSTRAEVDAHLRTCATCRDEVALSRAGVHAAEGLGEPSLPQGLGDAAIAEATRLAAERSPEVTQLAGRARRRPATSRLLAAAGAAAAVLLLVAVAPKLGQGSNTGSADVAAGGAAASPAVSYPAAKGVEIQHGADYTFDALPPLVGAFRDAYVSTNSGGPIPAATGSTVTGGTEATRAPFLPPINDATADPSKLPAATACLNKAFDTPSGTLSRVILAMYQGQPAYFGVYLIGPGAELPPTLLQLNVASVHGCQPLGQTTTRL